MSEIDNIVQGFNAGYIIQQKRPEVFKQLESVLNEVELPFFDPFIKGGIEYNEERLKTLMLDKSIDTPVIDSPAIEDIDMDV